MLSAKQRKCLEYMVAGDLSQKEIAEQIKVSQQTICNWKKDADGFMAEYKQMIRQSLTDAAARASRKMEILLKNKSGMVQYMAAKDILDRAGFKPEENVNCSVGATVVIADDITAKKQDR